MSGASGGTRQVVKKRLQEIDVGLVFEPTQENSEEYLRMEAACSTLAGEIKEDWREPKTKRQISSTEIAIEMEIQDRVREALQLALDDYNAIAKKQAAMIKAYKGVLTKTEYKQLSGALHSDRYQNLDDVQRGWLDRSHAVVLGKKMELCGDDGTTDTSTLPKTVSDLVARRNQRK